jgi:murein DD-endopeptidase MepM/ murein hydrolase activator NlpD
MFAAGGRGADRGDRAIVRGPKRLGVTAIRGAHAGTIDLGNEPPLTIGNPDDEPPVRRAVHWRWLTGTVLTGFTSIFLMGGALMAALDNPNQFATSPESAGGASTDTGDPSDVQFGQKSDRMRAPEQEVASRQILQVSTVTRQGERDFIKLRPFAKITASLLTHPDKAAEVPVYDPLRIFADNAPVDDLQAAAPAAGPAAADDQIYGANVDGEVSVKVTDFAANDANVDTKIGPETPEVEQIVRAAANFAPEGDRVAALSYVDPTSFSDKGGEGDPFSALGVRIIPENVSNVEKSGAVDVAASGPSEQFIAVTKGMSFRALLQGNGVTGGDADQIVSALSDLVDLNAMHVGQKIRIAFAPDDADPARTRPIRVSVYADGVHQATIARADNNGFVRADEPSVEEDLVADTGDGSDAAVQPDTASGLPQIYDAVYQTALEQEVPKPLIDQLIRIFAFDVDFQGRITPGDSLEVFHSMQAPGDKEAGDPEILYASLTLGGVTKRFYRYRTSDDGYVDYYDEDGKSAKKFLMRKPMTSGILRSGFGWRIHPVLGYRRLHTGADFAAPRGTPIMAAGNGIVEKASMTSGYGNFTLIRHTNGYETGYGHQNAFAKGIVPGARVRQGQIIGYVGSTGLSTGPHLHFEIRVNGSAVDPLRIRLPRGRVLEADLLSGFEKERERIDALLATPASPAKVASAASN